MDEIPHYAIAMRVVKLRKTIRGATEDQLQRFALTYLQNVVAEIEEYGAKVTWERRDG